jgi:sulfite exporter TauE/SafE
MSQSEELRSRSGLHFSLLLISGSLLCVLLFGAIVGALSSTLVESSGIARMRAVQALFFMWVGTVGITIGGSLYLS